MNELKFPFKFKHPVHDCEFTANQSDNGEISITWDDGSGIEVNNDYTYDDAIYWIKEGFWNLVQESTPQKDERDGYIEELEAQVENLEELITMLSQEDESQKQRAEVFDMLSTQLMNHSSFEDINGSSRATELAYQVNLLLCVYDEYVESKQAIKPWKGNSVNYRNPPFKPVSEMTTEDWQMAVREYHVFELRNGDTTTISNVEEGLIYPVETAINRYNWNGQECIGSKSEQDIIRRVK